eukprot:6181264-Pleurochrysis_carterae.AAC.5
MYKYRARPATKVIPLWSMCLCSCVLKGQALDVCGCGCALTAVAYHLVKAPTRSKQQAWSGVWDEEMYAQKGIHLL